LALSEGLNYAVIQVVPVDDVLCWVEEVIHALSKETAEEFWQETVRIMKGKHKSNLTSVERLSLQALETSEEPSVLPSENVTMVLSTVHYNWKITALLEDQA
jgi:hypothetical protein